LAGRAEKRDPFKEDLAQRRQGAKQGRDKKKGVKKDEI
jgi:hypothetical protein